MPKLCALASCCNNSATKGNELFFMSGMLAECFWFEGGTALDRKKKNSGLRLVNAF